MRKTLEKKIEKSFVVPTVQSHADNKKLMSIQNVMENVADCIASPYGHIVGVDGNLPIYADVETNINVVGNPGSGKTLIATANLLSHVGSVVSLEIGGSTFKKTYNYRKWDLGQNIYVFDPRNIVGLGCSNYNPMDDLIPEEPDFYPRILTMASALISDSEGHKEQNPYFRKNPSGLIAAMIVYLKLADTSIIPDEQKNFIFLTKIFSQFPSASWEKHIKALKEWRGEHSELLNQFGTYLSEAQPGDQNVRSIVSATSQWLTDWASDKRLGQRMTSSDFSMMDLRDKKTTLYIVMPSVEDYITYQPWLRLILQSAIDSTPNPGDGGKGFQQKDRILFMIDELTQLGHLQVVATGAQTVRQKGITLCSLFQSYANLRHVYGEEQASAFMNSAEIVQFLRNHDEKTLEYISKRLGRYLVYVPSASEGQVVQISVGKQKSVAIGKGRQISQQTSKTNSVTKMAQKTKNWAITVANFRSWGRSMASANSHASGGQGPVNTTGITDTTNVGEGSSETIMDGGAITEGGSTQEGNTVANGTAELENKTEQKVRSKVESLSKQHNVAQQPMIIDGLDFRQIETAFSGKKQILFYNGREGAHCTLGRQVLYYEIPLLKERAEGPPIPEAPAFPDPPKKTIVQLKPMSPVDLEDFKLDESKLSWNPKNLVAWKPPAELSEWGQGAKDTREAYEAARYRLDKFDEKPGFFNGFFRNPFAKVATVAGVAATCYIGGSIATAGITFGTLMLTGVACASWRRYKLVREKFVCWKTYTDMRGAAMEMVRSQLAPVMAAHDANHAHIGETVKRQHELVTGNGGMETVLADQHKLLKGLLEEHRANLENCCGIFKGIRNGAVSGWSSGDWMQYVEDLHKYRRVREKFFDFDKGDYLVQPALVTPTKLGPPPPRTHYSRTAPMPEMFEAEVLAPEVLQELAVLPETGMETRGELQAYLDKPLTGYDLPDDIKTVGDAVTRRAELATSKKRRHRKDVMQLDAALESMDDPLLEKFDGLVRGYVSGLRQDEDTYTQLLRHQIREGQQNVIETIKKIRQFNGQVVRLNEAQVSFEGFASRLDEARAAAHHRAHARAIRDMEEMERAFDAQSERLRICGPLVPPKQPRKRPKLRIAQPPK